MLFWGQLQFAGSVLSGKKDIFDGSFVHITLPLLEDKGRGGDNVIS